METIVNQYY